MKTIGLSEAINEFKEKRNEVVQNFVLGCISMGEVLYRHRELLKPTGKWMEYCSEVGLHITMANQQIRLYQYSLEEDKKEVLEKIISSWAKLNLFLGLNDQEKDLVLNSNLTQESSTEEFKKVLDTHAEELSSKYGIEHIDTIDTEDEEVEVESLATFEQVTSSKISFDNIKVLSTEIQKTERMSAVSRNYIEGILQCKIGVQTLKKLQNKRKIVKPEEAEKIRDWLLNEIEDLSNILNDI